MKKVGIIIFIAALVIGVVVANVFSFGSVRAENLKPSFLNFSFKSGIKGSGNIVTENRELRDFKSIDVSSVFDVEIAAQKDYSVQIQADDNLLQYIKTEVNDWVLDISLEKRVNTRGRIKIRIGAPDIEKIEASGAAKISLVDLNNSELTLDSSGASRIVVKGKTARLNVDVSGASKIEAEELVADNALVDSSGASKVKVNVLGELTADASGASSVAYVGTPANVIKKTSGAGKVFAK